MKLTREQSRSGFSSASTAEQVTQGIDATGLTAVVTGASHGIGEETARVLALCGAHVVMAVRNVSAGEDVKQAILKEFPSAKIDVMKLDLSSMQSVRQFASEYMSLGHPLNILINNAGIMAVPFKLSHDGIELHFATNHVGHFLLTNLLLDTMKKSVKESNIEGRIVIVSSEGYRHSYKEGIRFDSINDESGYNRFRAYAQAKLANLLHSSELARRLKEGGIKITVNSLHPGEIATNILSHHGLLGNKFLFGFLKFLFRFWLRSIQQGAATTCYVALHPQVTGVTGQHFLDCNIYPRTGFAENEELSKKLWDFSESLIT